MKIVAEAHDYRELIEALRARSDALGMTREDVDARAGFGSGYSGHIFGALAVKGLNQYSMGPMLTALAVKVVLVVDEELEQALANHLANQRDPKKRKHASDGMPTVRTRKKRAHSQFAPAWGRVMNARRYLKMSFLARRASARKAARARWGIKPRRQDQGATG